MKIFLWLTGIIFWFPAMAFAHGMEGSVSYHNGVGVVSVAYDDGEPASYVKVVIRASGSKFSFQRGRTDRNGRFAFLPDVPGLWEIVVSDNMGHRTELKLNIENIANETQSSMSKPQTGFIVPREVAAFIGVLIILGIFGWIREILSFASRRK
ncbi:hypothetical protein [Thermodesulfatator atlanticus]|uniref:hypothetical protein n=1 Tax=Thermodesulfatator atlanticus TaxID=501497 RepID=UPI0004165C37|nr:hypothetical protein [Thermodesulfatator atlanticus]